MRIEPLLDRIEAMEADIATLREWGATPQAETPEITYRHVCEAIAELVAE